MVVKLNAPTAELVKIDVNTHPLFCRVWKEGGAARINKDNVAAFRATDGLAVLCLADDPVMYKETLDMAAIAPELFASFEDALSAAGFTDPAEGRAVAASLGIRKLPAVAVFLYGDLLGAIEGLKAWEDYQTELVKILTAPAKAKKSIPIAAI